MKNLLILGMLLTSSNVFASKFADLKSLSNPQLEAARKEIISLDVTTFADFKKVTVLKAKGATPQLQREATMAQAMHSLCQYFDEGVAVGIDPKNEAGTLTAVKTFSSYSDLYAEDKEYEALLKAVKTINAEPGVELYSGDASGNNTVGTVLGFYDTKTNEIAVFTSTNCGRED